MFTIHLSHFARLRGVRFRSTLPYQTEVFVAPRLAERSQLTDDDGAGRAREYFRFKFYIINTIRIDCLVGVMCPQNVLRNAGYRGKALCRNN